jgi:peroxiredoxin
MTLPNAEMFTLPIPMALRKLKVTRRSGVPVIGVAGALVLGAMGYQAVLRYGRVLLRLRALEEQLDHLIGREGDSLGLTIGRAVIEDFELAEVRGGRMSFSQWRGSRLLLVFFDPGSIPCQQLIPTLAELADQTQNSAPVPIIISTGDAATNLELLGGVSSPVLLQEDWELGMLFQVRITPMAYLVDEDGRIASSPAVGASAIRSLGSDGRPTPAPPTRNTDRLASGAPAYDSPAHEGLAVGTRAPGIHLPLLAGGDLSLSSYRGQQVLLVFWDPQYGPCLPLVTRLEAIHRDSPGPAILTISRGTEQVNRDVAAELGLTLPIGIQRHWEVSRKYAMFATPIAYLIDEQGMIAHDVVIGADSILAFAASQMNGQPESSRKDR